MTCIICNTDTSSIDPVSSEIFPVCVSCIDAKVLEIAARKFTDDFNEELVDGEDRMTVEEMAAHLSE